MRIMAHAPDAFSSLRSCEGAGDAHCYPALSKPLLGAEVPHECGACRPVLGRSRRQEIQNDSTQRERWVPCSKGWPYGVRAAF